MQLAETCVNKGNEVYDRQKQYAARSNATISLIFSENAVEQIY